MTLSDAQRYAARLMIELRIATSAHRIVEAGSVRRHKPLPNDIELVIQPRFGQDPAIAALTNVNLFDLRCQVLLDKGILEKRQAKSGQTAWGEKMKRAIYYVENRAVPVDMFSVLDKDSWGVILVIRTGPGDFNKLLVTTRDKGGACPLNRRVAGGHVWDINLAGTRIDAAHSAPVREFLKHMTRSTQINKVPTPDEAAFFAALDVPFVKPQHRTAERLKKIIRGQQWDADLNPEPGPYFGTSIYGEPKGLH